MNELSQILLPWLKKHGYKITGSPYSDFLEIAGTVTTVGWVYSDHVEVGTQLRSYAAVRMDGGVPDHLSTWHGSPFVILSPAKPDFFTKLLTALESASKVVYNFNSQKQIEDIPVPPRVD